MANTLCVIGIYFGQFPPYFPLWLKSCEKNPQLDFIIFTDQKLTNLPTNVIAKNLTLNEVKLRAESVLGFNVSLERPYKVCDFRPIYGLMFKDILSKYEYWAHTDFDMIYGDIYGMMDKYSYKNYDKFLPLGHLGFYHNTDEVSSYLKLSGSKVGNYKEVLTTDKSYAFDELGGIYSIYKENGLSVFDKPIMVDISRLYKRFRFAHNPITEQLKDYRFQTFYWENGHVYRAYYDGKQVHRDEWIYIHFKCRKHIPAPKFDISIINSFFITDKGFIAKSEGIPTLKEIIATNQPHIALEFFTKIKLKISNYLSTLKNT